MTGVYVKIERDGRWQNVEIDQLTDDEMVTLAKALPTKGWVFATFLAAWIRDNVNNVDN